MLTDAEFEKLKKTDPRDKSNDFIVRRKFQKWLAGLCYVSVIILHYLPEKQIKKIIKQEHILHLCNILLHLFSIMSVPMVQKSAHEYIAVVPYYPPRPATKEEILMMDTFIKPLIYGLFRKLSAEEARNIIKTELNAENGLRHPGYMLAINPEKEEKQ